MIGENKKAKERAVLLKIVLLNNGRYSNRKKYDFVYYMVDAKDEYNLLQYITV